MKYIQSFYNYPVTFSSIPITIPCRDADGEMRNICEIEDKDLEKLQNKEPYFRSLLNRKKIRVLNKLPESYKGAAVLVNEANAKAEKAIAEAEALKAKIAELEAKNQEAAEPAKNQETAEPAKDQEETDLKSATYQELQQKARDLGIENVNIKKTELIEAIKSAEK